jgi:hypothetical protein
MNPLRPTLTMLTYIGAYLSFFFDATKLVRRKKKQGEKSVSISTLSTNKNNIESFIIQKSRHKRSKKEAHLRSKNSYCHH